MRHVIEHTCFPRQLEEMEYMVRNSRSKDLREMVASYVRLVLGTWPAASMERERDRVSGIPRVGALLSY